MGIADVVLQADGDEWADDNSEEMRRTSKRKILLLLMILFLLREVPSHQRLRASCVTECAELRKYTRGLAVLTLRQRRFCLKCNLHCYGKERCAELKRSWNPQDPLTAPTPSNSCNQARAFSNAVLSWPCTPFFDIYAIFQRFHGLRQKWEDRIFLNLFHLKHNC